MLAQLTPSEEWAIYMGNLLHVVITEAGVGVAVAVGGFFAFLVVKKLMSWGRKAL